MAQVDDSIGVIIKRPGLGKFKCHLFVFDNAQLAHDTCVTLQQVTSEAFRLVRKSGHGEEGLSTAESARAV